MGPLSQHLDAYLAVVKEQGYLSATAGQQVRLIARFSQWLRRSKRELHDLDECVIKRFLDQRRDAHQIQRYDAATMKRLLGVLRQRGAAPERRLPAPSPQQQITAQYRRYLLEERGLSTATVRNYLPHIDQFLSASFGPGRLNLAHLRAPDVTSFLQRRVCNLSPGHGKILVTALRSFLGHLQHQGKIKTDLAACVPGVAGWSLASLPKFIPAASVQKVLDRCDRQTPTGRRDYAILLLLARLGLRANEVAVLNLEDIDWDNARITIHAKGGRWSQLPLPRDVGEAIAHYLRLGRPRCSCRRVFIRDCAPVTGFANSVAISALVKRALKKADVDSARKGAHVFRHSLATEMLRQGASLDEIGDLLRHKNLNTTAIYAKVDLAALRPLALPWPGGTR